MGIRKIRKWLGRQPVVVAVWNFFRLKDPKVKFLLEVLSPFPRLHCKLLIKHSVYYGLGKLYPRDFPANLKNPRYFNEKLMWLKYYAYNKSELCARCYDKYLVREYVSASGCGNTLNTLYGVWDRVEDIPWEELPDEYVLKRTNGCQDHVFRRRGETIDKLEASERLLKNSKEQRRMFIRTGNLFSVKMPQKYICEKLLTSSMGYESPEDYKFYCFNGEPRYLLFIWDRQDGKHREAFKWIDFSDASDFSCVAEPVQIEKPPCYEEMLEVCRKLSAPFPFVRVDLYVQNGRPVFGELTFTPAGGMVLDHVFDREGNVNYKALTEMGDLLKLPGKPGITKDTNL